MAHKSETLRQREKAQRDLLELKKMQSGELAPEEKEAPAPLSLDEKAENFFFYHKYKLLAAVAALVVLSIILYSTFATPDYDATLTIYCYEFVDEPEIKSVGIWANGIYPDLNKNGKAEVLTTDCSFGADTDLAETVKQRQLKIQSILTEPEAMLFILDNESLAYFDGLDTKVELFKEENMVELPQSFYDALNENRHSLKEGKTRYLCLRTVEGSALEGKAEENWLAAKEVIEKLKKDPS